MCLTTNQPDTKSNPNPNTNFNLTTKQHAIVSIQLNIVACSTYLEKFVRDSVIAPFVLTSTVIVTPPYDCRSNVSVDVVKKNIEVESLASS